MLTLCSRSADSLTNKPKTSSQNNGVSTWTNEQVSSWAREQGFSESTLQTLKDQDVTGKELLTLTYGELVSQPLKLPAGVAKRLVTYAKQLQSTGKHVLDSKPSLTGELLLEFIMTNSAFHGKFKKDFTGSSKLAKNAAKFPRVGRDDAIAAVYDAMANRLTARATAAEAGVRLGDRLNNPLPATLATTGGGKSFFLDVLAALRPEDLVLCTNTEMKEILQNSVSVPISFNGGTSFRERIDKHDRGIAVRALYSYFFGEGLQFDTFLNAIEPSFYGLDVLVAMNCIMAHSGKGVLLLVDELLKCGGKKRRDIGLINGVVSDIGSCLDTFTSHQFNTVVTTLNMLAFKNETASGRPIIWITLAPATLEDALSLFQKDALTSPVLARCISDCNGHYRSLESLSMLWQEVKGQSYTYPMLIQALGDSIDLKYSQLTLPLIKAALRGIVVDASAKADNKHTFGEYLEMGYFLNTPGTARDDSAAYHKSPKNRPSRFVPRISALQLLLYAQDYDDGPSVDEQCAGAIRRMLQLEANFNWQQYEEFHAYWEVLYRVLFASEKQQCSVAQLYQGGLQQTNNDPLFKMSAKNVHLLKWPTHFPCTVPKPKRTKTKPTVSKRKNNKLAESPMENPPFSTSELTSSVIMPAARDNPGFDIVCLETPANGVKSEPLILCVECRFSGPEATTELSLDEVKDKRDLTMRQFLPYFNKGAVLCGLTLKEENLFLVVCAWRKSAKNITRNLPSNTIVLDREKLKTLYTPSLYSRPQFILDEQRGQATQKKGQKGKE